MCSAVTLGPSFKVKQGYTNLKMPISPLLLLLGVWNVKPNWAHRSRLNNGSLALVSCLSSGYNLHQFYDSLGLVR